MNIIHWKPLNGLNSFFDGDFMNSVSLLQTDLAVDVYEKKGNIIAEMSLPGIKESEIDIAIEDDFLTISGQREEYKEEDKNNYYSKEIKRGAFSRTVRLPSIVDAEKSSAEYEKGVLKVTMPSVAGTRAKAIKVAIK